MTLDDVYGSDHDRFPLEQEAAGMSERISDDWDEEDLGLVWDEGEVERIALQLGAPRALHA